MNSMGKQEKNSLRFLLLLTFRPAGGDKLPQKTDSVAGRIFHYHSHLRSSSAWFFFFVFFYCILHLLHPHRLPLVQCVHPVQRDRNSRQEEAASLTHGEDVDMWILWLCVWRTLYKSCEMVGNPQGCIAWLYSICVTCQLACCCLILRQLTWGKVTIITATS